MRRSDREVTYNEKINDIIANCPCCRIGFYDEGEVYILPMSFGFTDIDGERTFYFHSAKEGRKINLIANAPRVGFELDTNYKIEAGEIACKTSAWYQSVIGTGVVSFIEDRAAKTAALELIMQHALGEGDWTFSDEHLDMTCVFKLDVEQLSCKERK